MKLHIAKRRKKRALTLLAATVLPALAIWTVWGNTALVLSTCTIGSSRLPAAFDGMRIAHVSDVHNTQLGADNERLLSMLREAAPDWIAITGDLLDARKTDLSAALHFVEQAMQIAPCYYVTGNHEARTPAYEALRSGLEAAGVVVLENERVQLTRAGEHIALLGVDDPAFRMSAGAGNSAEVMAGALSACVSQKDEFAVLLSHRPELLQVYADFGVDLVLCGHAHGGQARLPLIGGLIAPHQGLFPEYDAGLYTEGGTRMIVSRGIGNSLFPLRFNNRPEVVLVTLERTQ